MEENLRASSLFATLPEAALKGYSSLFRARQYERGEYIYLDGDAARCLHFICEGRVKIMRTSAEGEEMIVGFFGRGDFVGCCCLLDAVKLPCAAQAVEPTETLCITRDDFYRIMSEHPELAIRTLQEVTRRLRVAHHKMKNLALDTVEKRVVAALLELNERFGETTGKNGARVIRARVTRLELAEMAGTTLESASRTMSKLKRAGLIRSSREGIVIVSPQALAQQVS